MFEILSQNPGVNCILTINVWNGYTSNAKGLAKQQSVGLFTFKEFLGAINYDDE